MKNTLLTVVIGMCFSTAVFAGQDPNTPAAEKKPVNPIVKIKTTKGEIVAELYADKAPITVENFLKYTKEGLYNGTIFHRVIKGFMIQGGGISTEMVNKLPKPPIKNESYNKLRNERGTLAMARTQAPDSATNQFFINHVNNKSLDFDGPYKPGYAVFGKVIKGMEVVDAIASVKTKNSQYYDDKHKQNVPCQNVPVDPIVIESVTLVEKKCDAESCAKDCDKCPRKETCTKPCPKKGVCCKDGKCTQEGCPCCVDGKCCGKDCKCCKSVCTKDCDKCPKKESCEKACPGGTACCKDGKCTQEGCPCCVDGKCCGKDCKCCKKS